MSTQSITRWGRYLIGGLVALVFLAAGVGAVYQSAASARERRSYPMPGALVDVGGYRLHIYCVGEGSPTVVLESGHGESMLAWLAVQPEIAKFTRVCAYDRAGFGWSDPNPLPRNSHQFANDLHTLLVNFGIKGPYVLVGHSMGCWLTQVYAARYRSEMAGVVMIDSGPNPRAETTPEVVHAFARFRFRDNLASLTGPVGLSRMLGWCYPDYAPMQFRNHLALADCSPKTFRTMLAEWDYLDFIWAHPEQFPAPGSLGNIPLVVLSHDPAGRFFAEVSPEAAERYEKFSEAFHERLARLSAIGRRIIVERAAHHIQFDRPEVVIQTVREVVDEARRPPPLFSLPPA